MAAFNIVPYQAIVPPNPTAGTLFYNHDTSVNEGMKGAFDERRRAYLY